MGIEKIYEAAGLDPLVIPMVRFFNDNGLKTYMSCQGHEILYQSLFWIQFDKSVTKEDILRFMKRHLNKQGAFVSCGRFAKRLIGFYRIDMLEYSHSEHWEYIAASPAVADADLTRWERDRGDWKGVDDKDYVELREDMISSGRMLPPYIHNGKMVEAVNRRDEMLRQARN